MATVDEDSKLNPARTAVVKERVERGADSAAGVEHVINQHHIASDDIASDVTLLHHRLVADGRKVIAI